MYPVLGVLSFLTQLDRSGELWPENLICCCIFALKSMSLPRKIMEQCRLCPAKLWSNVDFAPRNHRTFVLCPAKSRRLRSLPRKIMEQCRLCSAKSRRYSFMGQQISSNLNFFTFFLIIFVNHCYFRDLYNLLDNFLRKKYFVSRYL